MKVGDWYYSATRERLYCGKGEQGMGFVYLVRLNVMGNTNLVKIGATSLGKTRLMQYKGERVGLCCISIPHYNFFENEEIMHEIFKKYRVPPKPGAGNAPELFNVSIPFILSQTKNLFFETNLSNVESVYFEHYPNPFYCSNRYKK